ncbi:ABC transporter ATP-binding protein [Porifericola rhodea]|uniref:ABC transporter ATP-binding protein n=1 Tax=Porifericola rhodea TaxID=930972 RepID=UPI002666D3DB|nr:ABC transporter ATP-binding protein [Porifericola rhodea]WKN31695.1 ABC transporter ATP-binding protein [Porifericola rhodea]
MPPLLEVNKLSKQYEGKTEAAIHDISFSLDKGQILTLTGESGSGKTTLLKAISGLIQTDAGKVFLDGEWVKGPDRMLVPGHPDIKMVYQHYELSPNLNVAQNIMRILRAYVKEYQQERTEELMELCKLSHLRAHYPRELSGGEKQRVALARAIAEEPVLLLMDEPFSNIDVSLKTHLKSELLEILRSLEITAIIVSHDPQDALSMADQVAVMQNGHLQQLDSPENVYRKPVNAYVAQLFGHCNLIAATDELAAQLNSQPKTTQLCIRAEDISVDEQGKSAWKAQVKNIRFMGAFYEVEVEMARQRLLFHHRANHIEVGDEISLSIPTHKIISLGTN